MELTFTSESKIKDVKKQFSKFFPFLKLEFYPNCHQKEESSLLQKTFSDSICLSEIHPTIKDSVFAFTSTTTVEEFEQRLQSEYNLPVQVFRKAGSLWLETVQTDNLSLGKQNTIGAESSSPLRFNIHTLFL